MASQYTENWEAYAEDTLLTAAPGWLVKAGSTYKVKTNAITGSKAAYVLAPGGVWAAAIYNGLNPTFDATAQFGWTVRLRNIRANVVWGIQADTLDGSTPVGCYIFQLLSPGAGDIVLYKTWNGGTGGVTSLATAVTPASVDASDYTAVIIQQAGRIRVWLNGATTPVVDYTDPSPLLTGKLGIQTFQAEAYWDAWDANPSPNVPGVPGAWAVDYHRHRGRR